jgi:Ran GTPase-activating protein (RanGAP) involved in mRNA processing and transport
VCAVQNTLGAVGGQALAAALAGNTALVSLRLDFNSIGDGIATIGDALMHNCALQVLSLQFNGIGPRGVSYIAEGLSRNSCLQSLDLAGNMMQVRNSRAAGAVHQVSLPHTVPHTIALLQRGMSTQASTRVTVCRSSSCTQFS